MTHEGLVNFMVSCKAPVGNTRGSWRRHHIRAHCISPTTSPIRYSVMVNVVIREVCASPASSTYISDWYFGPKVVNNVWTFSTYVPTPLTDHRIVMTPRLL